MAEVTVNELLSLVVFSIARSHCFLEDTGSCCSFMATDRDQKKGRRPRRSGEPVHTSWVRYQKLKTIGTLTKHVMYSMEGVSTYSMSGSEGEAGRNGLPSPLGLFITGPAK